MQYLGDFAEDETVYIPFNTFSSDDPQASVTITNLADADIMVHKDGGTTQIATDGATIAIDFDAITGNHLITIDTSVHADYSIGSDYLVRIEGTTVDGGTINAWVGSFSIENRSSSLNATALAALEDQYDGTGLTGDTYPASQSQLNSLGVVSGGFSAPFIGATVTTGTETLTYTATEEEDGVLHEVAADAGNTEFYYEIDVGETSTIISVEWRGYIQSNGDTVTVKYYDWVSTSYKTVRELSGSNGTTLVEDTFVFPVNATGTGANIGLGRLQFTSATSTNVATDRGRAIFAEKTGGIANGSTVTLGAATTNKNFIGNNWNLALGGQAISGSHFEGGNVSGVSSGSAEASFSGCHMNGCTLPPSHLHNCTWLSTITLASAGNYTFTLPSSEVAGAGAPVLDMNSVGAGTTVNIRGLKGSLTVNNLTTNHTITIGGEELGTITLNGADASVEIRGIYKALTNNLIGSPTVNTDGAIKGVDVAIILADTADMQPRVVAIETDTDELQQDWENGGRLDLILDARMAEASISTTAGAVDNVTLVDTTTVNTDTASIGVTKNAIFSNFEFMMVDATDHVTPETGLTVTGQMSIDGAAFASVNGSIAEVSNGIYQIDFTADDTNGDVITYRFSSAGAADTFVTIKTRA